MRALRLFYNFLLNIISLDIDNISYFKFKLNKRYSTIVTLQVSLSIPY